MNRTTQRFCGHHVVAAMSLFACLAARGEERSTDEISVVTPIGDQLVAEYFQLQTEQIAQRSLRDIKDLNDWLSRRGEYRRQLAEMLGLDPMPNRTPLDAAVVGTLSQDDFVVERLHFQPLPKLYVAANLYLPRDVTKPLPAILYVCGHANVIQGGVRMGNKTAYQHHGAWFARNGYVCLVVDTIQKGEFAGIHHGTYRHGMWWWNNRGYTPAGVEAWTAIRALDYLQSREEVDPERLGVTGRSGGGAYSWWLAALDDRVKAAVPVAGITTLRNHVVDGCIEGHCDCMYMLNTYRWDFPMVAALVAPRPLLISNSDKDRIFPLDGVVELHAQVRRIYELFDADDHLGLQITEGPHQDTQELRVHAFRWMNRFLKDDDSLIREPAEKRFEPGRLKVFDELPSDERVTTIHESFIAKTAPSRLPETLEELHQSAAASMTGLRNKTFAGWPSADLVPALDVRTVGVSERDDLSYSVYEFTSQEPYRLPFFVVESKQHSTGSAPVSVVVIEEDEWKALVSAFASVMPGFAWGTDADESSLDALAERVRASAGPVVFFAPRGVGLTRWSLDERERTHLRRRFMLLGQTADGMRIWDTVRLLAAIDDVDSLRGRSSLLRGSRDAAAWSLYASLFADGVVELILEDLAPRNRDGITLLNVSRIVETPELLLMAADRCESVVLKVRESDWPDWEAVASSAIWGPNENRIVVSRH